MRTERERLEEATRRAPTQVRDLLARVDAAPTSTPAEDETAGLVRAAQADEAGAREQLIERFLPLVSSVARRYQTEGLDQTDLLQEAIVGLLRALQRYDASHGVPFAAFATWWVRQALQEARSDFIRPFRLPPKALRQLAQLKSEHQRIYQLEHRLPGVAELAERTNIELEQAQALVAADAPRGSLDDSVDSDGELGTLGDLLEDPLSAAVYEEVIDAVAGEQLRALLSRLTERERDVVQARFGFDGETERLVDIAERLGVSAERVRQIEERALAKLRHAA